MRRIRESVREILQRGSLRRRVAYSLAIVRLILAPVIFLAIYYLFVMGRIVDRIVNKDAPAATLAQQASIEMLTARRAERTFLLFHDASSVQTADQSLKNVHDTLLQIQALEPEEQGKVHQALSAAKIYTDQFGTFVSTANESKNVAENQVQSVVRDYEKNLDALIRRRKTADETHLIDELRGRAASFDDQISNTIEATDPALMNVTTELQASSGQVLQTLSELEEQSWSDVQQDHREARRLLHRAEWTLSIVSVVTFLLSVWISFVLPKQVVQPLLNLKQAVDGAISDSQEPELNVPAEGELGQLAQSIRNLIADVRAGHPAHKT